MSGVLTAVALSLLSPPVAGTSTVRSASTVSPAGVRKLTLAAVGDIMFGRYTRRSRRYRAFGQDRPFRWVKTLLRGRDIVLCNLESPVTRHRYRKPEWGLNFRTPPEMLGVLKDAGFNVIGVANNHSLDMNDEGLRDTVDHIRAAGLHAAGIGKTEAEAWRPVIIDKNGIRVAIFAVTALRNFQTPQRVAAYAFIHRTRIHRELPERIRAWRGKVDFIIVSVHSGEEYRMYSDSWQRTLIRRLRRAGADVFIGHHPHVLRGMERRPGFAAFHGLGNFLFDYGRNWVRYGAIAYLDLIKEGRRKRLGHMRLLPVRQDRGRLPKPAVGRHARKVRRQLSYLSRNILERANVKRWGEGLELGLPRPQRGR